MPAAALAWDKDLHEKLEDNLGKALMVASRKVLTRPLSDERMECANYMNLALETETKSSEDKPEEITTDFCGSVEMKGVEGNDRRSYFLDVCL